MLDRRHLRIRLDPQAPDDPVGKAVRLRGPRPLPKARVAHQLDALVRHVAADHIGPGRGDGMCHDPCRRPARHRLRERQSELVQELRGRPCQVERHRARRVIGHDPSRKVAVRRLPPARLCTQDALEVRRYRVDLEEPLERPTEVIGLERGTVRVLDSPP